jgi:hypothetical protein
MAYFERFRRTKYTYEERVIPSPFFSAIGQMAIWFSELEDEISKAIVILLNIDANTGKIVTSELSFRNKVHIMSSLVKNAVGKRNFSFSDSELPLALNELVANCFKAEELRNQILHSSYELLDHNKQLFNRNKASAKSRMGLHVVKELVDAAYLQDVADFIIMVANDVDEFMIAPLN